LPRATIAINAALGALLLWLYLGDVSDVVRAQSSELAALSALPSLPFAAAALAATLAGLGLTVFGLTSKRDKSWRGYRVMPIVAVVALFIDLFVLSGGHSPFPSSTRAVAAVELFEQHATEAGSPNAVPSDTRVLEPILQSLGTVPWLVKGESVSDWKVKIFDACTGPKLDAAGERAGTFLYCVDATRSQAWVTLVGLPAEQRFGAPQVVTQGGVPLMGLVRTLPQPEPESDTQPGSIPDASSPSPSFNLEPDAGTLNPP
jgi:hypothetical protein